MKNWQDDRNYRKIRQPDGTVKNMIFVDGQAVEVTDEVFAAYSQMDRQERYQEEIREEIPHISWEKLADACVPIEEYMLEQAPSPEDICISMEDAAEQAALLRLLPEAMEQLTESEQELIRALFFEGVPAREYARRMGISDMAVRKKRDRILMKLKFILRNLNS
jgi:RNA polymerase sigma factor (sigma-70 family)